jgi:hypothetical protein
MANTILVPVTGSRLGVNLTGSVGLTPMLTPFTTIQFINPGNVALIIYNGTAGTIVATPQLTDAIEGAVVPSATMITALGVSIPTLNYMLIGPFSPLHFNTPNSPAGSMTVTFTSAVTALVTVGLIQIPLISP